MPAWGIVPSQGTGFSENVDIADSRQVMHNLLLHQCPAGVRAAIEWEALAVAYLEQPVVFRTEAVDLQNYLISADSPAFSAACWSMIATLPGVREVDKPNEEAKTACTVVELWTRWSKRFGMTTTSAGTPPLAAWRMWRPLAVLLCKKMWFGDICAVQQRATGRYGVRLRAEAPPFKLLKTYIDHKAIRQKPLFAHRLKIKTPCVFRIVRNFSLVCLLGRVPTKILNLIGVLVLLKAYQMGRMRNSLNLDTWMFLCTTFGCLELGWFWCAFLFCDTVSLEADTFALKAMAPPAATMTAPAIAQSSASAPVQLQGSARKWPSRHLLRAVLASADDKNLGNLHTSIKRKLEYVFAGDTEGIFEAMEQQGFRSPDAQALARARINLDIAAMAFERDQNLLRQECWRQLNFDSSPKGGLEIFAVREHIIENGCAASTTCNTWPLVSLGFGFAGAVDKTSALCHGIWLQTGDLLQARHMAASVYTVLTDHGVEAQVADFKDCLDAFFNRGEVTEEPEDHRDWLFPNALAVIDINHLFDWILKTTCQQLEFYETFQTQSKSIGKLLTTQSYVDAFVEGLRANPVAQTAEYVKAITSFKARFAKWRFGTLAEVCQDLASVEQALQVVRQELHDPQHTQLENPK
eukprot:6455945-Amphidinium_carterae.1